ncbi:N(G),N(G)-dimethylarginine dimethylaminohydrolase 1 [Maniola hyperantus]|uniref:N(G),N(G)-dimethylarginine dimethylaminohydrolase 1 n=1 Tax=Aphantopus hyperantus TaxID=2795564 RepID=UPI001568360D|nr:N(G),N(G)-dimethylarginine dimethylaminohydrolase 1 [Maniola hyperantus]
MDFKMHEYSHAVVGKMVPELRITDKADLNDARRQYDNYLRLLRELNLELIEIETDAFFPENIVFEDLAIVCHGIVLIPHPISATEEIIMVALKKVFKDLGQTIIEVNDPEAKLAGSDVLFTGREFFVGISETTNEAGASAVAETFPEFPCTPIKVAKGVRHLKRYISVAGPDVLCVSASKEAKEMLRRIESGASFTYQTLTVPENGAANCLYVNGTLIHRAIEEIPQSFKVFCEKIDFARRSICFTALARVSTGLTACCLLVRKA